MSAANRLTCKFLSYEFSRGNNQPKVKIINAKVDVMQISVMRWKQLKIPRRLNCNNRQNNWSCRQRSKQGIHRNESFSAEIFRTSSKSRDFWGWIIMKLLFFRSRCTCSELRMPLGECRILKLTLEAIEKVAANKKNCSRIDKFSSSSI